MAGSASRAQLMRAPRRAALAESLSSGYETHSGVSLANQQTIDQRRHLQTRANNNAQQSFLSAAALAYQSVTQFFIAVRLRAAKQTGLILGNDDSARGNGGSNASKQQTENIQRCFDHLISRWELSLTYVRASCTRCSCPMLNSGCRKVRDP
jgi:hypothetical protein